MPTQRDYSCALLLNAKTSTTGVTTGSFVDLGSSPSIAKRECKVLVISNSKSGTLALDYILYESTTNGVATADTVAYTADTTAQITADGVKEYHYWITKRYVKMVVTTLSVTTSDNVVATIQYLNRSA